MFYNKNKNIFRKIVQLKAHLKILELKMKCLKILFKNPWTPAPLFTIIKVG